MKYKVIAWTIENKAGLSFILFVASALLLIPIALLSRFSGPYEAAFNILPDKQHYFQKLELSPENNSYQIFATFEHNKNAVYKSAPILFSISNSSKIIYQERFELKCVSGGPGEKYDVKSDAIYGKFNVPIYGEYAISIELLEKPINIHEFQIYINAGQNNQLLQVAYILTSIFFVGSLVFGVANLLTYYRNKSMANKSPS